MYQTEQRIRELTAALGLSRHFEHLKIAEILEVDCYLATKWEAFDGSHGTLLDRIKLVIRHCEKEAVRAVYADIEERKRKFMEE